MPPIKCIPRQVYIESMSTRFEVFSDGSVQIVGQETVYEPDDFIAKRVRKEATRQRRNRNTRERRAKKMIKIVQENLAWLGKFGDGTE